jgi:putative flavoprotein involved in K+ transport
MGEVDLAIRWADGHVQRGTSPSRAIEEFVVEGAAYPWEELSRRLSDGLAAASERVRERYGFACTAAAEASDAFARGARQHGGAPGDLAHVEKVRRRADAVARTASPPLPDDVDVLIVGAGQAGLSLSWHLSELGVSHLLLERGRAAGAWSRGRWDSFCLVTPNWQCALPGHPYAGDDPDGFMVREEIIEYVASFAASFDPPLREGVAVETIEPSGDGFLARTSAGEVTARQVAMCVSGYHHPRVSSLAAGLPDAVTQLHSSRYRNPSSMPDGAVLVVGTGQSGAQIAEDLMIGGREVHLAVGSAPRCARRYRGRDCIAWLQDVGHYEMGVDDHPKGEAARREPNHYMTGRDGGHDLDLRTFARDGMMLHGRLKGCEDGVLTFDADLRQNLDGADATAERIKDTIDAWIDEKSLTAPREDRYAPVWAPDDDGSGSLDLAAAGVRSVVWATGFEADWSWVSVEEFTGETGDGPRHHRGVCEAEGLYVLGLPWLWTWGSGRFAGVDRDAAYVAGKIAQRAGVPAGA